MADNDVSSVLGFVDKRRGRGSAEQNAEKANMVDISSMRTRLAALNGSYYTSSKLNQMTENDMIYALRDTGSI